MEGIEEGLHTGAQLCTWLGGETVADGAVGEKSPGTAMTPDTVLPWLSSGKPIGAVAIAQLKERGELDYDQPVAEYVPEFVQNGKEAITVRHLLTHTGGIRTAEQANRLDSREEIIAAICAAPSEKDWTPGEKAGYHESAGWHMLGEIIRRLDGRPYEDYVRDEIFEPLGMDDSWAAMTPEVMDRYADRLAELYTVEDGDPQSAAEYSAEAMGPFARPGSSLRCPAHDLVRFYRMMLGSGELDGVRILSAESVAEIVSPQRLGMVDHTFRHKMDWGLGVIVDNKHHGETAPYGFGPHASPKTFGHGGNQSSVGFADPEHGLAVALIFNGLPGHPRHDRRLKRVTGAVYEDLGLVQQ